ncbi:putative reverse transcriptase domain-containing protein [Tanacetum coccineum]
MITTTLGMVTTTEMEMDARTRSLRHAGRLSLMARESRWHDSARDEKLSKSGDKKKGVSESGKQASMRVGNKKANHHRETAPCRAHFNCNQPGHLARCRITQTKYWQLVEATQIMETMEIQLRVVHSSWAPNVVMDVKPNNLNFSYVIEMENGRNEETNKIICGCTLVLEGIPINIDLIPFGPGSFDVVVGMEWLTKHRAEIICYEKIIRIALPNGETIKVHGEQPEKDQKRLSSMKTYEKKLKDIPIV